MKICRFILCLLLAVAMALTFCACGRDGEEGAEESVAPTGKEGGESAVPTQTADAAPMESGGTTALLDFTGGSQDCIVLSLEEFEARPRGIQTGTVFSYAAPHDVPNHLPWNCVLEGWLWGNVYEGLLYMYMNDPEDIRGCIAESWGHSDDHLTWTFQIRDGVTFTDGTDCDAYAVAKAWDYINEATPYAIKNCNISSWEAGSETEFTVRLSAPCGWFEAALCGNRLLIVSPTALELYGLNSNQAAVGTGPYRISSYQRYTANPYGDGSGGFVLSANPNYYLDEKLPCVETVNFQVFRDEDSIVSALLSGEIDGAGIGCGVVDIFGKDMSIERFNQLQENGYGGNLVICLGKGNPIWVNPKREPELKSREVREALVRFINYKAVNDRVYDGLGRVQDSIWAKGSSGYVSTDQYYCDAEEGQELLASVGMEASDISFRTKIYERDEILFVTIQDELGKAGVQMKVETLGPEASFTILTEAPIINDSAGYSSAAPYLPWDYILLPEAVNKLCWQDIDDPELYRKMLTEYGAMTKAETWDEMLVHCRQLTTYVQDDFGMIGGIQPPAFLALSKDFKNGVYFAEAHDIQLYYLYQ